MGGPEPYSKKHDIYRSASAISVPVVFLSVTAVMLLVSTAALYNAKESEKKEKINTQCRLDDTLAAKQGLESKLREMEIGRAVMEASLKTREEELAALSKRLEGEEVLSAEKSAVIKEKDAEISRLQARLEDMDAERDRLTSDIAKLNYDYLELKFYTKNIMKTKEEMNKEAMGIAESDALSLGTIVINQRPK